MINYTGFVTVGPVTIHENDLRKIEIELVRDAHAILEGIPIRRVNLRRWLREKDDITRADEISCGTIACAAGWISLHPGMQRHGLLMSSHGEPCAYNVEAREWVYAFEALMYVFKMPRSLTDWLFGARGEEDEREFRMRASDRNLWLRRCKLVVAAYNEVKQ